MKKNSKVNLNIPSLVKKKEQISLKTNNKEKNLQHQQYGTKFDDGQQSHNEFKNNINIINKKSKNGLISVRVGNPLNQQPKILLNLNKPTSAIIHSNKLIQVSSNKILPVDRKLPVILPTKGSIYVTQPMATSATPLSSMNNNKSVLKSNQPSEQLNTNNKEIDRSSIIGLKSQNNENNSTESNNNCLGDKLNNISPTINPLEIENNSTTEITSKDPSLQFPTQISSNVTISKSSNIIHRKEEPPFVSLLLNQQSILLPQQSMPIQIKPITHSAKSNMNNNLSISQKEKQNFCSTSKIKLSNGKFINIIGNNLSIANDKNEHESFILNPITGYFETIQNGNGNGNGNLKEDSLFNNIVKNVIEQEFNEPIVTQPQKFENNQIEKKTILEESSTNEAIQEIKVNKSELTVSDCTTASSDQSSANMKENVHSINSELPNEVGQPGHSIKENLQNGPVEKMNTELDENLLCSPRTKVRSKSLNLRKPMRNKRKSLPTTIKETLCEKTTEENQNCNKSPSKLLCNEKIQISPDILKPQDFQKQINTKVITPIKNNLILSEPLSGHTSQHKEAKVECKSTCEVIDLASSESQSPDLTDDIQYLSDSGNLNLEISKRLRNSAKSFLKNIGLQINDNDITKKSRLPLNFNKFGLLALNEKLPVNREIIGSSNYEKPIYYRENKGRNADDYVSNLYCCKGCHCFGAPEEFLSVNFCSKECIDKIEKKKLQNSTDAYNKIMGKGEKRQRKNISLLTSKISNIMIDQKAQSSNTSVANKKSVFSWPTYLNSTKSEPAGINLFLNPFPCGPNLFEVGMKLEAIDPEHNSLFCVCTIVEKKGFRLKLNFDSYSPIHDFWINADSMDIFPPGWCGKNQRNLTPPKTYVADEFNWTSYLINKKSTSAPRQIFTHLNSSSNTNPFKIGMKFEVEDSSIIRVGSVADLLDNRILIHFDGCGEKSSYWVDCGSPYIHPVNWHLYNNCEFVQPLNYIGTTFDWKKYLEDTNGIPVTEEIINAREPMGFRTGMKLEIVDKKNPSLIRPATVMMVDKYDIQILYDGWPPEYAFRVVDDNPDIHPIGWCKTTGHELEPPPGYETLPNFRLCPMVGCRGIGNYKNIDVDFHASLEECPYKLSNWSSDIKKPDRIGNSNLKLTYIEITKNKRKCNESIDYGAKRLFNLTPALKTSTPKINAKQTSSLLTDSDLYPSPHLIAPIVETPNEIDQRPLLNPRIKVSKQLLVDYGPRLESNLNYWSKTFTKIFITGASENQIKLLEKNPLQWSTNEVFHFIKDIPQCSNHIAEIFKNNQIDGEALLSLRQSDLQEILHIKLGPVVIIFNFVIYLRGEVLERYKK